MRIDAVVLDCRDAAPLARFWAAALEWHVAPYDEEELARLASKGIFDPEDDPTVMVEPPDDSDLPVIFLVEVPEEKVVKNRTHLDLQPARSWRSRWSGWRGLGRRSETGPRGTAACGA